MTATGIASVGVARLNQAPAQQTLAERLGRAIGDDLPIALGVVAGRFGEPIDVEAEVADGAAERERAHRAGARSRRAGARTRSTSCS